MAWTKTYTGDESIRINKWLAQEGVCSRREADALIEQGLIKLDDVPVTMAGERVGPGQTVSLTDAASRRLDNQLSVILNKPVGFVSGTPEPGETPAIRLVTGENLSGNAHAVPQRSNKMAPLGRLDKDSRGLLILSEDGVLAKAIIGPLSEMDKEYLVRVKGDITEAKLALLRHGLELDGRKLRPALIVREKGPLLRFTLTEGRNRQIRRMCELVDLRVQDLQRVRVGPIVLAGLPEGKWRPLGARERAALLAAGAGEEVRFRPSGSHPSERGKSRPERAGSGTDRDKPRTFRDKSGQPGARSGHGGTDKPRFGARPDRDGQRPDRSGPRPDGAGPKPDRAPKREDGKPGRPVRTGGPSKPARPGGKPAASSSAPADNRPSALKGEKFKRTKLGPRERKPIK